MRVIPRSKTRSSYAASALALLVFACGGPTGNLDGSSFDNQGPPAFGAGVEPNAGEPSTSPGDTTNPGDEPSPLTPVGSGGEVPGSEGPGDVPLDMTGTPPGTAETPVQPGTEPVPPPPPPLVGSLESPTRGTTNLFTDLLGIPDAEVDAKLVQAVNRVFGIGTGESSTPVRNSGYRLYYELPQDPSMAFIWAPDSNDIRSEGMSYGMMVAVQMDMQQQFDRLWKFAQTFMQYPGNSNLTAWRYYFRWQGSVNTANPSSWAVNYGAQTGPAPDGEEYFAIALYLADRRWGSGGSVNYRADADNLARAMINNAPAGGRTPVINAGSNMVVFYPQGNSANFSDPSYHLPAFYEIFAQSTSGADAARWRQIAETSRQYFVTSAHPTTGLHPDYANFNGTPNTGGSNHDDFRFDAWRVVMNMAVDYAWFSADARLQTQVEKYHAFFANHLREGNVTNALFNVDGSGADGGGSTALTATLAAGALASDAPNRERYVENLWDVPQQSGEYRYYQETVYLLGLLSAAGQFGYEWADAAAP